MLYSNMKWKCFPYWTKIFFAILNFFTFFSVSFSHILEIFSEFIILQSKKDLTVGGIELSRAKLALNPNVFRLQTLTQIKNNSCFMGASACPFPFFQSQVHSLWETWADLNQAPNLAGPGVFRWKSRLWKWEGVGRNLWQQSWVRADLLCPKVLGMTSTFALNTLTKFWVS